jgi:WD40 repeat protein
VHADGALECGVLGGVLARRQAHRQRVGGRYREGLGFSDRQGGDCPTLSSPNRLLLRALMRRACLVHEQECTLRGHSAAVNSVAFSPDGTRVVSASGQHGESDNTVRIWDVASGKEVVASGPGHARY